MIDRLNIIENRYNELSEMLKLEEYINDYNKSKILLKEQSDIEDVYNEYQLYKKTTSEIEELELMISDPDYKEFATEELELSKKRLEEIEKRLEFLLIPKDPNDGKDIVMEIRGAAGGDEANIFAGDLFKMYTKFAERKNWKIDVINAIEGTSGGFTQIEFNIKGENVYSFLKYESGSHRVQRVPDTETQGRIHTSTSTVVVMPEAEEIDVDIKESDIKMDVFHSSGAGGQSVNTSNSAVRLTHEPTGVVVSCQTERSQLKNKERAMSLLKTRIYYALEEQKEKEFGAERKSKIGTGDRSEKIRTYNYPQNRVTDHRINYSVMDLEKVMNGFIDDIINELINEDLKMKLAGNNK